jgi:hypothetical protein
MGWFNWNNVEASNEISDKYLCIWCGDEFDSEGATKFHELDCGKAPSNIQQREKELTSDWEKFENTPLMHQLVLDGYESGKMKHWYPDVDWIVGLMIERAKKHEKLLEFEEAAVIYKEYGMENDVIRVRKEARNKVDQTVIHGDYVDDRDTTYIDDRDTIIQDSVISKSNIGAGGDDKVAKLEKIANLKREGLIDDDEFKQMKKEILEK